MGLLSIDDLKPLIEPTDHPCVSLYMPTYQAGSEVRQNSIRFKNLIKQAEEQLGESGLQHTEVLNLLEPAMDLDAEEFWQHQQQGLALFIGPQTLHYYRLPVNLPELTVVSDRFHLKPLLPLLAGDGLFYVLALSQKRIRLFEGDRNHIHEVDLPDVPQTLEEALQYEETAQAGQFRIATAKGGTSNSFQQAGSYHGQGSPDRDEHQVAILQFFHIINGHLRPYLRNTKAPLVLSGVEFLFPIYRDANTFPHLIDEGVALHPDVLNPEELRDRVWPLVEPFFTQAQQGALNHFHELSNTDRTTTNPKEIIPAAFYSRIEQLFVPVGVQQWGQFDAQNNLLEFHSDPQPGDEDLLNAAALQTLLTGGTVYALQPEDMPDGAMAAAVLRF